MHFVRRIVRRGQRRLFVSALWFGFALLVPAVSSAQTQCGDPVTDGFESQTINFPKKYWYKKQLVRGEYWFEKNKVSVGKYSLAISGRKSQLLRNEIRLLPKCQAEFGRGSWYSFSLLAHGYMPEIDSIRHVVGQWKESTGRSPFVAQRLDNKIFHISIETEIEIGNALVECRTIIAKSPGDIYKIIALGSSTSDNVISECPNLDLKKDLNLEVTTHQPPCVGEPSSGPACLPSLFGDWVKMRYFIKGGLVAEDPIKKGGTLEIWANDRKIVSVKGSFGHLSRCNDQQYFKIGVYRDVPGRDDASKQAFLDSFVSEAKKENRRLSEVTIYFDEFRHGSIKD